MPNIICRALSFGYSSAESDLFTHLDLIIDTGWRVALVGRNGRGKTTLMRLLAGELIPDSGEIERPVSCRLYTDRLDRGASSAWEAARAMAGPFQQMERDMERLLESAAADDLHRYGELESGYRERGGYQLDAALERELDGLEVLPALRNKLFRELSGGEQTRCLLAGLFALERGYPLIDEPTNHLDLNGRRQLSTYLASKQGFLLVSHDRAFLDAAVDHIIALNPDTVESHRSSYSTWRQGYLERLAEQARSNAALRADIRRFESTAAVRRRGADVREADKTARGKRQLPSERGGDSGFIGARAARQMKKAITAERRAEAAAESRRDSLTDVEKDYPLKLTPAEPGLGADAPLRRVTNLVASRGRPLFLPLSFSLTAGERLAVVGPNGSGKTTLLDLLAGEPGDYQGVLECPRHVRISRAAQLPRWTRGGLKEHLEEAGLDESRFRQIMAALGVRGSVLEQPLGKLSQGQLKKVELARSMIEPAHLLIWDEPLNYIDVETRERIEALLVDCDTALVVVEHDVRFIERVATGTVELKPC